MAELRLKNLTKRFGSYVGVDNFNLDIADQEFIVLLGPSGCGKTTTMRMIAGPRGGLRGGDLARQQDGQQAGAQRPRH